MDDGARDLYRDVLDELKGDPSLDETEIGVGVHEGVVTVWGTIKSYAQKIAAERAVRRVRGVRGLIDRLSVELPSFHRHDDNDLAIAAVEALRWNANLPPNSVVVRVDNGWLTLLGTVDFHYQREAARLAVTALAGIRGFTSDIALRQREIPLDVLAKIRESFRRNAEIEGDLIEVESHDGTVTLRGIVRSFGEGEDAATAAYSVAGVEHVHNLTTVV